MLWRLWALVCGLPLGLLAGLAFLREPRPLGLAGCALAAGAALAIGVSLLARRAGDEIDRGRHLAAASSAAWLAAPGALAVWFEWPPGRFAWVASVGVVLALSLLAGTRALGPPSSGLRWVARAAGAVVGGGMALLALAAGAAAVGARKPRPSVPLAAALFSIDAEVATRPLPVCSAEPRAVTVLPAAGAHPALSPDGTELWYDAPVAADGGRRQLHRLDRATGVSVCWTCGQPGNNVRPSVSPSGVALVYDSDRHRTWRHPDDTDLYLIGIAKLVDRPEPGRRLTFSHEPDDHPVFGPGPQMVTWSRREDGRYQVVTASIRSGHGGILLGTPGLLAAGGAAWIAPVAWSPDARTLVVASGNPFAALRGTAIDPTDGRSVRIDEPVATAASFDADGGWLAFATTHGRHWAGALPRAFGFALAPWADAVARRAPLRDGTGIRTARASSVGEATAVHLPDAVADWGAPAGLALEPDGSGFVIGQRRQQAGHLVERLVAVQLDCTVTAGPGATAVGTSAR